jgi:hypothetical protein
MKTIFIKTKDFDHPANGTCLVCRNKIRNVYLTFSGGAFFMNRNKRTGGPDHRMDAYLNTFFHGGDGEKGKFAGIFVDQLIIEQSKGGQFRLLFCGIKCLRKFFNNVIDDLRLQIRRALQAKLKKQKKSK